LLVYLGFSSCKVCWASCVLQ